MDPLGKEIRLATFRRKNPFSQESGFPSNGSGLTKRESPGRRVPNRGLSVFPAAGAIAGINQILRKSDFCAGK
jgi:hypothetical protein